MIHDRNNPLEWLDLAREATPNTFAWDDRLQHLLSTRGFRSISECAPHTQWLIVRKMLKATLIHIQTEAAAIDAEHESETASTGTVT